MKKWSPVANTFTRPVGLEVGLLSIGRARREGAPLIHHAQPVTEQAMRSPSQTGTLPPDPRSPASVRALTQAELPPLVDAIDKGELYPADVLRAFGAEGAFASHMPAERGPDLAAGHRRDVGIGEYCGATAFMAWCQDTLAWYVGNSQNAALKEQLLAPVRQRRATRRHRVSPTR